MTETIRYSLIGKEDINFGLGSFEVELADGRRVMLSQIDVGRILRDATLSTPLSVTPTGTSTARALADRFVDILNVKDFGAKGDAASDDTSALQAALNAVPTGGGHVSLPSGTYLLNRPLTIAVSGTTFRGTGYDSLLSWPQSIADAGAGNATGYVILGSGAATTTLTYSNLRVENLRIKGNAPRTTTTPVFTLQKVNGILFGYGAVRESVVTGCYLEQIPMEGILLTTTLGQIGDGNMIAGNYIVNCNGGGISCASGNLVRAKIIDNLIRDCNGAGIEWSSEGAVIARNHLQNLEGGGIALEGATTQTQWSLITENVIDTVGQFNGGTAVANGIQIGESSGRAHTLVSHNTLHTIAGHGITTAGVTANSTDVIVVGNSVDGFGTAGKTYAPDFGLGANGISIQSADRSAAFNNVVRATTGAEGVGVNVGGPGARASAGNVTHGTFLNADIYYANAADGRFGIDFPSGVPTVGGTGTVRFAGAAGSASSPAVRLANNRLIAWLDQAGGTTNGAFIYLDAANKLQLGAGNDFRFTIDPNAIKAALSNVGMVIPNGTGYYLLDNAGVLTNQGYIFYNAANELLLGARNATQMTVSLGVQIGSPTGGAQGTGTLNIQGDIYKNNAVYANPDYVFRRWLTSRISKRPIQG